MVWFGRVPRARQLSKDRPGPIPGSSGYGASAPIELSEEELVAHLCKGSRVTGQLTFHGTAQIDGKVDGEIQCRGRLTIGAEAQIRANISGNVIVIRGQVEGDVSASEKIELGAPARLLGNIDAPRLVIAEGVAFDGGCAMSRSRNRDEFLAPLSSSSEIFEGGAPKLVTTLEK
ncbi:MAG TPA: polymer-forming cytoskeletal protein [Candidatus Binatia bacterium]|jgi:cytoskeletal protein CcmA (bactofilin family)